MEVPNLRELRYGWGGLGSSSGDTSEKGQDELGDEEGEDKEGGEGAGGVGEEGGGWQRKSGEGG